MHKKILRRGPGGIGENQKRGNSLDKRSEKNLPRLKKGKNNFINKLFAKVYEEYQIEGQNLVNLLNKLKKSGVEVVKVRLIKRNLLTLRVKVKDLQKFFAITNNLCYNIKKVRRSGKLLFLYDLVSDPSIIVGGIVFILLSIYFSTFILGVSFVGNGKEYKSEVAAYLSEVGIEKNSSFLSVDFDKLANDILSSSEKFSFVSCKKRGNTLGKI